MTRRADLEHGSASLESVIVLPFLLLLLLWATEAGLYSHGREVARASAREGVQATRAYNGDVAAGQQRTHRYLDELGGRLLIVQDVSVRRTATRAEVTVTGEVRGVLSWPPLRFRETSSAPVERFAPGGVSP